MLDELAQRWGLAPSARAKARFKGRVAEGRAVSGQELPGAPGRGPRVVLLWPMTYMNEAGRCAGPARGSYRLSLEQVLVIHDEIDLPFGEVRTRLGGGLAGHNGLKSLSREMGGPGFWRVRAGVGRPPSSDPEIVASYVLSRFREPRAEVAQLVARASRAAEELILGRMA